MNARTTLITPFLLGVLLLLASGCAEDEVQMLVIGNAVLDTQSDECIIDSPNLEGPFRTRGVLDLALNDRYIMYPTILNQLGPSAESRQQSQGQDGVGDILTESNTVQITQATVTYQLDPSLQGSIAIPSKVETPISLTIFPDSLSVVDIEIISDKLGQALLGSFQGLPTGFKGVRISILVTVSFEGKTTGGADVASSEFTFPLDLCVGCLVTFPPSTIAVNGATGDSECRIGDSENSLNISTDDIPCNFGQDSPITCDVCLNANLGDGLEKEDICQP